VRPLACANVSTLDTARRHAVYGMQGVKARIGLAVPGWPIRPQPLCLEAGVAYLVVVGEDGACRCPFGIRRQQRVGRLSGTTTLPPRQDKTHQLPNPREHLFPRLGCTGLKSHRESGGASKATCGSRQAQARRGSDRGVRDRTGPEPPMLTGLLTGRAATPRDEWIQGGTTPRHPPSSKA
jgi:hypothetical protein